MNDKRTEQEFKQKLKLNSPQLITRPLHNLVKKDQKWDWTAKQENVFEELKKFTK